MGGDIIVGIDNKIVRNINDILVYTMREKEVGDSIILTIVRDGQISEISTTVDAMPTEYIQRSSQRICPQ
jgi:S1-C subfamily serine protease